MKLPNVGRLVGLGKAVVMANRPEILLGSSIAAGLGSTVLAARGGYISGQQVMAADVLATQNDVPVLTLQDKVLLTWKNYVPAAGVYLTGLASTVGLHWAHVADKKALVATGLAAVEEVRKNSAEYISDIEETVREKVTPKKFEEITESIIDKQLQDVRESDGILEPMYVLRDKHSGNHHWGNRNDVIDAVTQLNRSIVDNGDADLNTFYNHAGWSDTDHGGEVGWTGGQRVTVRWSLATRDDGTPVAQFQLEPAPIRDYDRPNR